MLQDLDFGYLDNQYHHECVCDKDIVVCVKGKSILLCRGSGELLTLPDWKQVQIWSEDWKQWLDEPLQYAFSLQGKRYFLWMGEAGEVEGDSYTYVSVNDLRQMTAKNVCFALMTAWHIYSWYRVNRYCGNCGHPTIHDDKERMMRCSKCGNMIFPRIAPAVIIGLTNGDKLMLSQYAANRNYKRYGLLAGFIEIGETAEEAVAREVMEEVGLKVKNIRYYKSQPWGIAGNLSIGYFCDLDGDDHVHLDENELSLAEWYDRDNLPAKDDGFSLTREMVRIFGEGKEPK